MGRISEKYKLDILEKHDSELICLTDLSFEEMSKNFKIYKNAHSFKIYKSTNNSVWKVEVFYSEGAITQYKDLFKDLTKLSDKNKKHLELLLNNMFQLNFNPPTKEGITFSNNLKYSDLEILKNGHQLYDEGCSKMNNISSENIFTGEEIVKFTKEHTLYNTLDSSNVLVIYNNYTRDIPTKIDNFIFINIPLVDGLNNIKKDIKSFFKTSPDILVLVDYPNNSDMDEVIKFYTSAGIKVLNMQKSLV